MGRAERRLRREQMRAEAKGRTQRGLCSRCGERATQHPDGNCPDGNGRFTWAMDRAGMASMIAQLEKLQAERAAMPTVTRDEQRVLDALADLALGSSAEGGPSQFAAASLLLTPHAPRPLLGPELVADETGLPLHHVRALLESLVQKGMVERGPRGGLS